MTGTGNGAATPAGAGSASRKRFYARVAVAPAPPGGPGAALFRVLLDDRPLRTPARRLLELPGEALARALAEEWERQGERIEPRTMPLTRLVNSALDGVAGRHAEVADDIVRYAGSDLVCYRADHPAELVERQRAAWDPLLVWAAADLGAPLAVASGIVHVAQEPAVLGTLRSRIVDLGTLQLAAVHVMTTLTGSALIALAHAFGRLEAQAAWAAAHVDEDWQISQWGEDAEAAERRRLRHTEFLAASRLFVLSA